MRLLGGDVVSYVTSVIDCGARKSSAQESVCQQQAFSFGLEVETILDMHRRCSAFQLPHPKARGHDPKENNP